MPVVKQTFSRIKLQSRFRPRTLMRPSYIVPELRMSGKWLSNVGLDIGSRVEIKEHPEGLLIKKIEE